MPTITPTPRRARWSIVCGIAVLGILVSSRPAAHPHGRSPESLLEREGRVDTLLSQMTLAEKIGQMTQPDHKFLKDPADIERYALGSLLSGGNSDPKEGNSLEAWTDLYDRYQQHTAKTRLKIPLLYGVDAVHGHSNVQGAVIFPHNIGLGATRDSALVQKIAAVTAQEVRATGIHWTFAPCVCVPQDARWGRTYEGFSEDPELVARLGAASIRGFQGTSLHGPLSVLATAKHYLADGGTAFGTGVGGRGLDQGDARIDEPTLRRVHLRPYAAAVAAGVGSIMVSYSSWNGGKVSGNRHLLTDVLKHELGFQGFLVSDYRAVNQIDPDYKTAIEKSINAGMDMVMVPDTYREFIGHLTDLVNEGRVPLSRIDDAVRRILRVKAAMGLVGAEPTPVADRTLHRSFGSAEHRAVARQAVRESLVLLKNRARTLPVSKTVARVHVAGKSADNLGHQAGGWTISWQGASGDVTPGGTTILAAIKRAVSPHTTVTFSADGTGAAGADAAIAVIGEPPYAEMLGDKSDLALDSADIATVRNLNAAGVPVAVVLISGRPLILGGVIEQADALVAAWLPGTEGDGVADVLFGDYRPTGKLPYTWPRATVQLSAHRGDAGYDPLFPFGSASRTERDAPRRPHGDQRGGTRRTNGARVGFDPEPLLPASRPLRPGSRWGDIGPLVRLPLSPPVHWRIGMAVSTGRTLLPLALVLAVYTAAHAQAAAPAPSGATAAWTVRVKGDIRWQQVTPAGALLVSTDAGLAGVDIERGQVAWEKPELGGLPPDSVRMVEGSLLMEAARPGLLVIFDPVTGAVVFDSRRLQLTQVVTRRVLPQSGTLLVHGRRAAGPPVVALYDLVTGDQRWTNEGLFEQTEARKKGLGGLVQGLARMASEGMALEVLQAGPDMIVVHTLLGLRALDAHTGAARWSATLPTGGREGHLARSARLYPSLDKPDRIYVSFENRLMAYRLADGQALWATPATVDGHIRDIVQHPAGIIMLPEAPQPGEPTGNRRVVNGVVQTGLNVARYDDGTTIAAKPLRMRGNVIDAMIAGDAVVLAVDAESRTFVNVLDVATATLRLKDDVKIKGQLAYVELTPAGLLYVSRPDVRTNAEVNVIDLAKGEPRFKDAIESGKPLSTEDYNAGRYYLHHAVEGRTLYVFANRDHRLYAVDRDAGTFHALGGEIKLQGGEDPTEMELRPAGIVLIAPQNLVVVARDGQVKQQAYYPAPQLPGLLRALHRINAIRAGLYGAAASAYGDAFAQASRQATDTTARRITGQLAAAYTTGGAQLAGYAHQSAALATKRFRASLVVSGSVFMLTRAPDGNGNILLQLDKESAQPRARVDLGKEREPVYAVDDVAGMLFLRTASGTLVGYRL